jgi:ABC-2 type transport system permease protein
VRSAALDAPPAGGLDATAPRSIWWTLPRRVGALCIVEVQKMRHDRTEIYTRAIQPLLWLVIFGETFTRIRAIPTDGVPYLDYLAPGILAQSALFIAIFYGIQIIWERDAGVLTKLIVTPTPRAALILGKSFAAGIRALSQFVVVLIASVILGVHLTDNPLNILGAAAIVLLGAGFFATLSMTIAGLALSRDRLMGIGQAITMPLFFASNALYPAKIMPGWVQAIVVVNPLSYQVNALRGLLIGTSAAIALDFGVVILALMIGIVAASSLLGRLARAG